MTKATKRILMSVFTLVLTLVALGTTTFAWFSLGTVSQVTGFEGTVQAGEGLEIRMRLAGQAENVGWTSWKTHLDADDWATVWAATEQDDEDKTTFRFTAIERLEGDLKKFEASQTTGYLIQGSDTTQNIDYLAVEFQFRSQSDEKFVALTNIDFVNYDGTKDGDGNVDEQYTLSRDLDIAMTDFTNNKTLDIVSEDGETTVQLNPVNALRVTMDNGTEEDRKDYYSGHNIGTDNVATVGQWNFHEVKGNKFFESDETTPITTPLAYTHDVIDVDDEDTLVLKGFTGAADGYGYYTTSLTMFLWLDGWDPHTFDVIFQQTFKANFTFALLTPQVDPSNP